MNDLPIVKITKEHIDSLASCSIFLDNFQMTINDSGNNAVAVVNDINISSDNISCDFMGLVGLCDVKK
ncbi:14444_t:CDS:2 [Entrophospora sp. SA101]|nr:14444_t:CDS:2 [Entrophospora sp. SA101]